MGEAPGSMDDIGSQVSYSRAVERPRRHGAQKDKLEYATSWTRAFYDIYEKVIWLESYCRINELATYK